MSEKPLVSVIVPAYNVERWIERCVESVLAQTLTDLEVIVIDDGSPDNAGALADAVAERDARVRVIHQKNAGLSAARNVGIEAARGSLLYFLDSDDYIDPDCLEILYGAMVGTGAAMVVGGLVEVDEAGKELERVLVAPKVVDERGYWEAFEKDYQGEEYVEYIVSWNKLYERSIFDHERFDVGKLHEDELIIHRLVARAGTVAFANTSGYRYVQTTGSIMHTPKPGPFLDAAEGFLARCVYFEERGWLDLAFSALCEARGSLVQCIETNPDTISDERLLNLKAGCFAAQSRFGPKTRGEVKRRLDGFFFTFAPRLYVAMDAKRKL